jgi:hypothetical protein
METFQLYTCCPEAECTGYRDAMAFFRTWGIEPSIDYDEIEESHFFGFVIPEEWTERKRRRFHRAFGAKVSYSRPE